MMPPCGTFSYSVILPCDALESQGPWDCRSDEEPRRTGNRLFDFRLLGFSPKIRIGDGWITLEASGPDRALEKEFSFGVDPGLNYVLKKGDVMHLVRSATGDIGFSVIRGKDLIVAVGAVTAVPLSSSVRVAVALALRDKVEAVYRKVDPDFHLSEVPVEVRIDGHRRLLVSGRKLKVGRYHVVAEHGFLPGMPGRMECLSITLTGSCQRGTGARSAALLS